MPYEPPSGWLEGTDDPTNESTIVFTRDSVSVRTAHGSAIPAPLVGVERPGHAPRCPLCAPE